MARGGLDLPGFVVFAVSMVDIVIGPLKQQSGSFRSFSLDAVSRFSSNQQMFQQTTVAAGGGSVGFYDESTVCK